METIRGMQRAKLVALVSQDIEKARRLASERIEALYRSTTTWVPQDVKVIPSS
jgi:hypothetical protein